MAKAMVVGLSKLDRSVGPCIYCWYIDGVPYYVGSSVEIETRAWNHVMMIFEAKGYWCDVADHFDEHGVKIDILEVVDGVMGHYGLKPFELRWIKRLLPLSQKCDGTDHIIPLNNREYDLENIKERWGNKHEQCQKDDRQ